MSLHGCRIRISIVYCILSPQAFYCIILHLCVPYSMSTKQSDCSIALCPDGLGAPTLTPSGPSSIAIVDNVSENVSSHNVLLENLRSNDSADRIVVDGLGQEHALAHPKPSNKTPAVSGPTLAGSYIPIDAFF